MLSKWLFSPCVRPLAQERGKSTHSGPVYSQLRRDFPAVAAELGTQNCALVNMARSDEPFWRSGLAERRTPRPTTAKTTPQSQATGALVEYGDILN